MTSPGLSADPEINGICSDSREVQPGFLFVAFKESYPDGSMFIDDALAKGAVAILTSDNVSLPVSISVPILASLNPRRSYSLLLAYFHKQRPPSIMAVTGTNGKSSVVSFLRQLWNYNGVKGASIGTLGVECEYFSTPLPLTTPDARVTHMELAKLAGCGVESVAIEASSHGLDQYRIDGLEISAGGFTNLGRDHLDYHGSLPNYFTSKARLFDEVMGPGGVAVINKDSPYCGELSDICVNRGHKLIRYGSSQHEGVSNAVDLQLVQVVTKKNGLQIKVRYRGEVKGFDTPLIGRFQADNLLCAMGLALASGIPFDSLIKNAPRITAVRGRMELVARSSAGGAIYVDYAHTPDALHSALLALRSHTSGKLYLVFGCGGERDPGKRPLMGRVAAELADHVFVTDDNPRGEDPSSIRSAILTICKNSSEIGDREEAISRAIGWLDHDDTLLIAGKGHETSQIVGCRTIKFDDIQVVRGILGIQGPR